ncbi:MAG: GGDEF domain-containing protein [Anaerolineales bacterium]|nr:GGDEF domain-containing protein [Anaerolineales bacterium]
MRKLIVRLGQTKSVIVITLFSWLASVLVTLGVVFIFSRFGRIQDIASHLTIASLVPLILTPPISWFIIGLFLRIDQLEVKMRDAATYDSLTGLLNRRAFMEQGNYLFNLANREHFGFSVLVVDLDQFKTINDKFGHAAGDKVLESFGKNALEFSRKSDLAGRLGGEEFAFILPNSSADQAWTFAERLHEAVRKTIVEHENSEVFCTLSIGIAAFPEDRLIDIEKSLGMADKAMYRAKENGRNQSVVYSESMGTG